MSTGKKYLRFHELCARGIVRNRVTLANWVRDRGFPPGVLAGPNCRLWDEDLVDAWLASRPTNPKPAPNLPRSQHKHVPQIPRDT